MYEHRLNPFCLFITKAMNLMHLKILENAIQKTLYLTYIYYILY